MINTVWAWLIDPVHALGLLAISGPAWAVAHVWAFRGDPGWQGRLARVIETGGLSLITRRTDR